MNRQTVNVPYAMMQAAERNFYIDWRGQPEAERAGGGTQIVFNAFPRWMADLSFTFSRDASGFWRSLQWQAQGRVGMYRLFMVDPMLFTAPDMPPKVDDLDNAFGVQPYAGPAWTFTDPPQVTAEAAAVAGASSIQVTVDDIALLPKVGQIISADDWPMGVTSVTANGGTSYTLGVALQRATISIGDPINLVATGIFEATSDTAGAAGYGVPRVTSPALTFREVLNR